MTRLFAIFILSFLFISCTTKKLTKKEIAASNVCKPNWKYFSLQDTIIGEVIYHAPASFGCGVLATASSTIIKTALNDTMRILWLCNEQMNFIKFQIVKIIPANRPSFNVIPPVRPNQFDCTVQNTYFGFVRSISSSTYTSER